MKTIVFLLGCFAFLLAPTVSRAMPVLVHDPSAPIETSPLLDADHARSDRLALKMDWSLPSPGKYGDGYLTQGRHQSILGNAWQSWLVAVGLLVVGVSLVLRWHARGARARIDTQPWWNRSPDQEGEHAAPTDPSPEIGAAGRVIRVVAKKSLHQLKEQAEPLEHIVVQLAPRKARSSLVERAMERRSPVPHSSDLES